MSGMTTANTEVLNRSQVWSSMLKDILYDTLEAQKYVNWIGDFTDGDNYTIPSIGDIEITDYEVDTAVEYTALDTGEFQFNITEYVSAGTYITKKARQNLLYAAQLEAQFVPKMNRAIMEDLEIHILKEGQPRTGNPAGYQTPGNLNLINGHAHRFVASGSNAVIAVEDFARAKLSLKKANVPMVNLVAIVDPTVAYTLETTANLINISANPQWQGIVETGLTTGMRFIRNVYGFDVYESNYLALSGADQTGAAETIDGTASGTNAVCNIFFSASPDVIPFIGAWRQMPEVDGEFNKDFQREEYVMTTRYGTKIYRPENLVTVLTSTAVFA